MLTSDERKQIANFQDAIADVIDTYLMEGMDPDLMRGVLQAEATSDLAARRIEIEERERRADELATYCPATDAR